MSRRITIKEAEIFCRDIGITIRKRDGEFRVARVAERGKSNEDGAYYTNDIDDAVNTAWAMHTSL